MVRPVPFLYNVGLILVLSSGLSIYCAMQEDDEVSDYVETNDTDDSDVEVVEVQPPAKRQRRPAVKPAAKAADEEPLHLNHQASAPVGASRFMGGSKKSSKNLPCFGRLGIMGLRVLSTTR